MSQDPNQHLVDGKYGINDLVDMARLRKIFEMFTKATGFTIGFLDHPGMNILIASGWRDICTKYHRLCPKAIENCLRSNRHLLDQLTEPGKVVVEACDNGLVDCAVPIIIKGKHIASLATGQLLLKAPDLVYFRAQAKAFGIEEESYLKALREIPVVSEEQLRHVTGLLGEIAFMISEQGYTSLTAKDEALRLEQEIVERKRAEEYLRLSSEILGVLNENLLLADALSRILSVIQKELDFDAVGFRLKDGDDYPYFVQNGFSKEFLMTENTLVAHDQGGCICRDKDGNICLECICGLVLSGQTDPQSALFTSGGSAWTNDPSGILALSADKDPRIHPRNRCFHEGYNSVALIPIRVDQKIVGLLQLNDRRKNRFSLEKIRFLEVVSTVIGVALGRHEQAEALRKSEERHRETVEFAVDGILLGSPGGRIIGANSQMQRLTGRSLDQLLGQHARILFDPQELAEVPLRFDLLNDGQTVVHERRLVRPDGTKLAVEMHSKRMPDGTYQSIYRDITERRRAQEALRDSEERLRKIIEQSPIAMAIVSMNGEIEFINHKAEKVFGYPHEEIFSMERWWTLAYPDEAYRQAVVADWMARVERAIKQGCEIDGGEYVVTCKDQSVKTVFISGVPVAGKIFVLFNDITERKRAEEALRDSEERLRLTISSANQGLYDLNFSTGEVIVSPEYVRMLGYEPSELRVTLDLWRDAIHPDDVEKMGKLLGECISGQRDEYRAEYRWKTKSGEWKWVYSQGKIVSRAVEGEARPLRMLGIHMDITDRKKVEQALRENEQRFRAIFNSTFQFTCLMTPNGTLIEANKSAVDFTGMRPEDVTHRPFWEGPWWRGNDKRVERLKQAVVRAAAGEFVRYEEELQGAGNTTMVADFSITSVFNSNGQVALLVAEARDITERKQAENTLRESEERFRSYFELPLSGIAITSLEKGWIEVNDQTCALLGYSREELYRMTWAEMTHPDDIATDVEHFDRMVSGQIEQYSMEKRFIRKDGEVVWTDLAVGCVRESKGKVQYVVALLNDISQRKRAQEELRKRDELLREAQHLARLGSYALDITTGLWKSSEVLDQIFGIEVVEEHHFDEWTAVMHPDDRAMMVDYFKNDVLGQGKPFDKDYRIVRRTDGAERWMHGLGRLDFDAQGHPVKMNGTIQDITERKLVEAELDQYRQHLEQEVEKRTAQLALVNAHLLQSEKMVSLGRLAAGVAHEINNPLAFMSANIGVLDKYAETIENTLQLYMQLESVLPETLPEEVQKAVRFVRDFKTEAHLENVLSDFRQLILETNQGADRVKKIVQDLKTFVREDKEDREVVNPHEIVERAVNIIWNKIKYNIELVKEYGTLPSILCYPRKMEQVLVNLLDNAAAAIGERGKIVLRTFVQDGFVVIEVEDTGSGIPEHDLPFIFDPFFTTKEVGKGTGLGLSIVYNIIQQHHGQITAESLPGQGTVFKIRLPIK